MSLSAGKAARLIGGGKVNEHNSAMGKTPPCIVHIKDGTLATLDLLEGARGAFATMLAGLMVTNSLASVTANPDDTLKLGPTYNVAGKRDDWPEANANRLARVILADATRQTTYKLDIPCIADGTSEDDIRTALAAFLAAYEVVKDPTGGNLARMTDIVSVTITSR